MECSQNNVDNDFSTVGKQNSELDVNMDGVISGNWRLENSQDALSNLLTAIGSSVSNVSLDTAMSVMTVETNLHADADPPLDRRMSFSTASEMSSEEIYEENDMYFNGLSPVKVKEGENGIVGFEMVCDGQKVSVVDSLECLARLETASLEPVHFDPRVYLGVPFLSDDPEIYSYTPSPSESRQSSEDVTTANLGPSSAEFAQYLLELEKQ